MVVVRLLAAVTWLALVVAGAAAAQPIPAPWQSPLNRDHPLVGSIWDLGAARFIAPADLEARIAASRFVVLGENHDNPDHHALQARLLAAVVAAGRSPSVAYEMWDTSQQGALDTYLRDHPRDAAGLGDAIGWDDWPDWSMYQPIAEVALAAGLRLVAANAPLPVLQAASQGGLGALDPAFVARTGLGRPLADAAQTALAAEMASAHCGITPDVANRMTVIQRVWDASLADSLVRNATPSGAVLIAGSGHARTDRAVPAIVRLADPGASVLAVAFVEVAPGLTVPGQYAAFQFAAALPFDYVWFTPGTPKPPACGP